MGKPENKRHRRRNQKTTRKDWEKPENKWEWRRRHKEQMVKEVGESGKQYGEEGTTEQTGKREEKAENN